MIIDLLNELRCEEFQKYLQLTIINTKTSNKLNLHTLVVLFRISIIVYLLYQQFPLSVFLQKVLSLFDQYPNKIYYYYPYIKLYNIYTEGKRAFFFMLSTARFLSSSKDLACFLLKLSTMYLLDKKTHCFTQYFFKNNIRDLKTFYWKFFLFFFFL